MSSKGAQDSYATEIVDKNVGDTVEVTLNDSGAPTEATVAEKTAYVSADDWPEVGESVTFKAVGGETEKTVAAIDEDRDRPIQVEHGGWYDRSCFVEYTRTETHKVLELPDGRELWASPGDE